MQVLKRSERSKKIRAVAQHFFRWGHRRCPKANEGAVEGANRRSATVTAKPAAAAFKLLEKSRSFFLPFCFFENSYNKNAAAGFETKWAFEKNASSGAAFFPMRAQEVPESERSRRGGSCHGGQRPSRQNLQYLQRFPFCCKFACATVILY